MSSSKNALVIGVSEYENISKLTNTVSDAEDMAKALRKLGFSVMLETNPTLTEFEDALENFSTSIQYNKEIALFYYSGHGIQVDGKNYLIPKDAELDREIRIKKQTIDLEEVINSLSEARNLLNIFILDACRDNPFAGKFRSVNRGLAEIKKMPPSTYFAFAAAAGQTAGDGNEIDKNGIFTDSFLKVLEENPSDELDMIFRKTRANVLKKTRNAQEPWTNHNLSERYYLAPKQINPEEVKDREGDYLDLVRAVYADGVIVDSERKLLKKKQGELKLSDDRVSELEAQVKSEYANEIKEHEEKVETLGYASSQEKQKLAEDERIQQEKEKKRLEEERIKKETQEKEHLEKQRLDKEQIEIEKEKLTLNVESNYGEELTSKSQVANSGNSQKKFLIGFAAILLLSVVGWFGFREKKLSETITDLPKEIAELPKEIIPLQKEITDKNGIEFVLVPAGEFLMGCAGSIEPDGKIKYIDNACSPNEKPLHKVKITKPFYMGKYEVTQRQWKEIMGNNPSQYSVCGLDCPVERVTWRDSQRFIKKLNDTNAANAATAASASSSNSGVVVYRLPTEAEWEYASRGGTNSKYFWGDDPKLYNEYMWNYRNTGNSNKTTHPVGKKKPNQFGLYDILGNVSEFVQDSSSEDYYSKSPEIDPKGLDSGEMRFIRGSNINDDIDRARNSYRFHASSVDAYYAWGLRLLLEVSDNKEAYNKNTPTLNPNANPQIDNEKRTKDEQLLADQKKAADAKRKLENLTQECESGEYTWNGTKCVKKSEASNADNGKWSAYQGEMNWEDAKAKCARLGMRLPTISELKAAYAAKVTESWRMEGGVYWSSTPDTDGVAYYLNVSTGSAGYYYYDTKTHFRCLR